MEQREENDRLLTTSQVAEWINTPATTLRWWRSQGIGPNGFRLGRRKVMYRESEVIRWLAEQERAGK